MVHRDQVGSIRLIPAHARKTSAFIDETAGTSAHLCSHGENPKVIRQVLPRNGSSPLTQGKRWRRRWRVSRRGLIPAHAGKTTPPPTQPATSPAHPRSRGENPSGGDDGQSISGSSPLTRGKPDAPQPRALVRGLIPAHAGKTGTKRRGRCDRTAHPRSRGENACGNGGPRPAGGSSPLTRGKPGAGSGAGWGRGLIPAHAGKTVLSCGKANLWWAHPRSRGENDVDQFGVEGGGGSSPLTRGKHCSTSWGWGPCRLIPAHAGKTYSAHASPKPRPAHPRSRGENWCQDWRGALC